MASERDTARAIIAAIGGAGNVRGLTHCATRLRFELVDASRVDQAAIDANPAVLAGFPRQGDRYQVVIGGDVEDVYHAVMALPGMADESDGVPVADRSPIGGMAVGSAATESTTTTANANTAADASLADTPIPTALRERGTRWLAWFFEYLSDSFRPIIGVLLGASIVIAIVNLVAAFGVRTADVGSPGWMFVTAMWKGVFYFLPIIVAYNASRKLKVDPWLGAMIMAAFMTPQYTGLMDLPVASCSVNATLGSRSCTVPVFGLPMLVSDYSGNVFVPLLMVLALAGLYHGLRRVVPANMRMVFMPFLCMAVITPLTGFVIGPFGVWLSNGICTALAWLSVHAPFAFAVLLPLIYPFLVPVGLHWPLNALMLMNVQLLGYDFIQGPMAVWNFACFGSTAGVLIVSLRERNAAMRATASGALAAGLLGGLTEPSLYGIHLRYRLVYRRMLAGCAAGGVVIGVLGLMFPSVTPSGAVVHVVTASAFAFTSLLTIPLFDPMWVYVVAIGVGFLVPMLLIVALDYRTPEERERMRARGAAGVSSAGRDDDGRDGHRDDGHDDDAVADPGRIVEPADNIEPADDVESADSAVTPESESVVASNSSDDDVTCIGAPVPGHTIALDDVNDPVFASRALGEGVGIMPVIDPVEGTETTVVAPVSGTLKTVAKTGHAFGIKTDDGIEVLVHIGIGTVRMNGTGFAMAVSKGEQVSAGDVLATVDFGRIVKAGCSAVTVMTVANSSRMTTVSPVLDAMLSAGETAIRVER
ncbi:PTS glucose transporter subunit IIA [Bifidobacterium callimiconis]|uniref:glucose PTS transporter subunit IIA n=1 Tax=Bifidobacterium callimiconis TaxID=2306973 RepID=UPI001BDCC260|nr:glucose PTS transporter subunit IIA [Bifidobacterium callimiconis]MBT1177331.1 PTS glucose transporter subunit IIA [Bifidobacterium callimiconis]